MSYDRNPLAYPRPFSIDENGSDRPQAHEPQDGITLRELAALHAFQGILAGYWSNNQEAGMSKAEAAKEAFAYADAFIAERNRPADEAEAERRKEREMHRERILRARYLCADRYHYQFADGKKDCRFLFHRTRHEMLLVEVLTHDDGLGNQEWAPAPHEEWAGLAREIDSKDIFDLTNDEGWGMNATYYKQFLPAWAQAVLTGTPDDKEPEPE